MCHHVWCFYGEKPYSFRWPYPAVFSKFLAYVSSAVLGRYPNCWYCLTVKARNEGSPSNSIIHRVSPYCVQFGFSFVFLVRGAWLSFDHDLFFTFVIKLFKNGQVLIRSNTKSQMNTRFITFLSMSLCRTQISCFFVYLFHNCFVVKFEFFGIIGFQRGLYHHLVGTTTTRSAIRESLFSLSLFFI